MDKKYILGFVIVIAALIGGIIYFNNKSNGPANNIDAAPLAQCLKDKGAVFYGAFWCTHCQATKKLFGKAKDLLPYVECSTPDGTAQLPICTEKGIQGYPTWIFADGSRLSGQQSFEALAEKSGCPLPVGANANDVGEVTNGTTGDAAR